MSRRAPSAPLLLYGHRGAPAELPENTLPSFRRAIERGADAIETDVHLTADGHVVISHDPTGQRMAGVGQAIGRSTLAEVQSWDAGWGFVDGSGARPFAGADYRVPTLAEVLEELPELPINVEIKQRQPSMVGPVLTLVRRHRAEARVRLASFERAVLREIRSRGFPGPTGLARAEVAVLLAFPRAGRPLWPWKGAAAQVPVRSGRLRLDGRPFIDKCHALGLRVDYWTINDVELAQRLLERGADGIMTDDPQAMAPLFERWRAMRR